MRARMWPVARRNRVGGFPGVPSGGAAPGEPPEPGIYVSLTGSDTTGDGSIGSPYRSLKKAATMTVPGVTVYLRGGYYDVVGTDVFLGFGTAEQECRMDGTQSAPITVRSYPGEWAVFDGINHPDWPLSESARDPSDPVMMWLTHQWTNYEYLEFRNSPGRGVRAHMLDSKFRFCVFQNVHSSGLHIDGSRNEIAYCLSQDNFSVSNGGNSGNGYVSLVTESQINQAHRFPAETEGRDNHYHHNIARNNSDDGINNHPSVQESLYEYNIAFDNGYGASGNGYGVKMGLGGTAPGSTYRYNLAWGNSEGGFTTNGCSGILIHNNTSYDNPFGFALYSGSYSAGNGDNEAYNNISRNASTTHRTYESGVTVHTHNAGYLTPTRWDPLGGEGNFDTENVDPEFVSLVWTNADFLRLAPTSPYLSNGKVITGGSTTLGAIPDGEDFAGGWDWRTLVNTYPSHGLKGRAIMYPLVQGTRTPYPGT